MTTKLRDRLAAIVPTPRTGLDASQARQHIRADFDAITDARKREVTWQQIAQAIAEVGIRAEDGSKLEWRAVMGLYHAERYLRGGRPKRRARKPPESAPSASAPAPSTPAPAALSKPVTQTAPAAPRKYPYDFGGPVRFK
jgi:hypothetical protein